MVRYVAMTIYFYIDANDQKQGPVSKRRLRILASQGTIKPETPLETNTGRKCFAAQIPSLWDSSLASESPVPFHWETFFFTIVACAIVIFGALLTGALIFLFVAPATAILFLLLMRQLFHIESHLQSIRELYESK